MEVVFAENGRDGIELLRSTGEVDLVLMDVMMPDMDGNQTTAQIRSMSQFSELPVLFLTAKDATEDKVTGPAEARTLVAGIPDARLALVPGASHLAPVEQPAAVTDLLLMHFSTAWQDTQASIPVPPSPGFSAPFAPVVPVAEISAAAALPDVSSDALSGLYDRGTKVRREVLGDAHVDAATAASDGFTDDYQDLLTRYAWGEIWTRPGLDLRSRRVLVIGTMVALGRWEELRMHIRAALEHGGFTADQIKEIVLQQAIYCGVPAGVDAFRSAREELRELGLLD